MVETIGRDTSLIIEDPSKKGETFRAIVESHHRIIPGYVVKVNVKPSKMFIFNPNTGELIT